MNRNLYKGFILGLWILSSNGLTAKAATIPWNIATASLTVSGTSTDDYIITGTTTTNFVVVNAGYQGIITLSDVNISLSGTDSPIDIKGQNNRSNLTPVSNVGIILEGNNILRYAGIGGCAFQVEQGAQINISAIDPSDNASGKLEATVTTPNGGAGIGALSRSGSTNEATATVTIIGGCTSQVTAGGNIVISSGTVTARGGHGAGIGGGYQSYYDGMIVIYGGVVNASTIVHAAGIGSGCPNGTGVTPCYTPNSAIIVLPPAQITATGAANSQNVPVPALALA